MQTSQHSTQKADNGNLTTLKSLEDFIRVAQTSHEMLKDHQIYTSLGEAVAKFNEEPIAAATDTYQNLSEFLLYNIKGYTGYELYRFNTTQDLYAQVEGQNHIHFYIVIDQDGSDIRGAYYEFLDSYRASEYSAMFPISFHFIGSNSAHNLKEGSEHIHKSD